MTYRLRFFTHDFGEEQLIKEYCYPHAVVVPRIHDNIMIDEEIYVVRKISMDYENADTEEMYIEVMLDHANYDEEWWM